MPPLHAEVAQEALQVPGPQVIPAPQAPGLQATEQLADREQSIPPSQAPSWHVTEHAPRPHTERVLHASTPQLMLQSVDALQSVPLTQARSAHVTSQVPAPHSIRLGQAPAAVHSMLQLEAWVQSIPDLQLLAPHTT